jgi:ketosteroid isomerase-like protein
VSDGNAELVSAAFDAWNRRDLDALLALCEPDVVVRSLMTEAERAIYDGAPGVRDWLEAVLDVFPDWQPLPRRIDDYGDALVVCVHVNATARNSGIPLDQDFWLAARLSEAGRLRFWGFYRTEELAREAAGIGGYGRPMSSTR